MSRHQPDCWCQVLPGMWMVHISPLVNWARRRRQRLTNLKLLGEDTLALAWPRGLGPAGTGYGVWYREPSLAGTLRRK